MRFQRIHEAVCFQPWFINPAGYSSVRSILESALTGERQAQAGMLDELFAQRPEMTTDDNGIATIYAQGVLGHHLSNLERMCGATDYSQITEDFQLAQQGAKGILLIADSPGGMVAGCDECAKVIAGSTIPVVTFTDGQAASAMYYLASGSRWITATRSSVSGSIGTILPWIDKSKMWELAGVKWEPITPTGADLKGTGSGPSLTPSMREYLQEMVDEMAGQFREHVLSNRGPDDEVWRAGSYRGDRALAFGLIDQVGSREDAYDKLIGLTQIKE
jgi:ClpP class serine protease